MSLYIHVGQCGNQIALPLWKIAEAQQSKQHTSNQSLFDEVDGFSRAIFIDSEPKVVAKTCQNLTKVRPSNVVLETSGCGNNWSMGFSSCHDQDKTERTRFKSDEARKGIFSMSVETIRKESERFDNMRSLVMIHSIGGGTGSGMGSALLQHLRDDFPSSWIVPIVVGPFSRGDNPLQYYNNMFSIQYLNEYADAVVYTNNDILSSASGLSQGNFHHLNQSFAEDISCTFFPLRQSKTDFIDQSMGQFISSLCPLQRLRFLRIGSCSQPSGGMSVGSGIAHSTVPIAWEALAKKAVEKLGIDRSRPHSAFSIYGTVRGCDRKSAQVMNDVESSLLKHNKAVSRWHPSPTTIVQASCPMNHTSRSVAVAANRSEMGTIVRHVAKMAAIKYHSRAYLHSYRRYGIYEEDFAEAFESMNHIVAAYDELLPPSSQ